VRHERATDSFQRADGAHIAGRHEDSDTACGEAAAARRQAAQPKQPSEQAAFEDWLYRVCPSGDETEVQRQWEASSELANWLESQRTEDVLIDGAVYTVPTEVACELLRLHMELQAAQPTGAVLNTKLKDGHD
jgi:hypothetical protein